MAKRARTAVALLILLPALSISGYLRATPAWACDPSLYPTNDHCYALAEMVHTGYSYDAGIATITPTCLYTSATGNGNFVSQEMWVWTDNTTIGQYWVETGTITVQSNQYQWFWANFYPGASQIYVHYEGPSVSMSNDYTATIQYATSNQWDIYVAINGGAENQYGTASYNPPYSHGMYAGTEYTASGDRDTATATKLKFQRQSDGTIGDWWGDTPPQAVGPGHYISPTMPSDTEVDWSSC